ncbi:MAG: Enoyl-CoA hydratase/isomerase [Acidimicrobiales bacterium]|nr:Enoyl-CoA hydratase/isomerase [Acidimicrobiales bacterium]
MTPGELVDAIRSHTAADRFATPAGGAVAVDLDAGTPVPDGLAADLAELGASLPFVVVGLRGHDADPGSVGAAAPGWLPLVDVLVDPGAPEADALAATMAAAPRAATALALLLRGGERRTVADGLVAESMAYSTLQAGPEFAAWRAQRPVRDHDDAGAPRVRCERSGPVLQVTLTRPAARNALDARMRDELCSALLVAVADPSVERVVLAGEGPSFCAGGDLDEFGSRADPATGHLVRLHRSPARLLAALGPRVVAQLHGACMGSGVELPAFAGRVEAAPDTRLGLPEIGLGLVPGAGGTVSLPARIGRHRTAWLALTGQTIDAATAAAWGLVDTVISPSTPG